MHADENGNIVVPSKLVLEKETHAVIGCAMDILNEIGHGFFEKVYENALIVGFKKKDIPYKQQSRYSIRYQGETVGEYIPDIIAYDQIVVEIKTIDRITPHEEGQVLNYLKVCNLRLGLILNFKNARLEWKRIIL
ncbi:MAG TPA: GxxExxY protein [Rhodospirillaceae bacterium]|nr:GxxExxY protein [Rhodospirillaceae bacterium]